MAHNFVKNKNEKKKNLKSKIHIHNVKPMNNNTIKGENNK